MGIIKSPKIITHTAMHYQLPRFDFDDGFRYFSPSRPTTALSITEGNNYMKRS